MPVLENEKELENYLINLEVDDQECHPLGVYGKVFQQVHIKSYGTMDLVAVSVDNCGPRRVCVCVQIIELKRQKIDVNAVAQIARYKQAIERILSANRRKIKSPRKGEIKIEINVSGILVGQEISDGDVCFLMDSIDWLKVYTFKLSLSKGITFHEKSGWHNTGEDLSTIPLFSKVKPILVGAFKDSRASTRDHRDYLKAVSSLDQF